MKNALKSLSFLMVLGGLIFISSCSDDDGGIIIDDGGGDGGFSVADGLYIAAISGSDTTVSNSALLSDWEVEGPDFGTLERSGHSAVFVYLTAGDYFFGDISGGAVVNSWGGTSENVTVDLTDPANGGQLGAYTLVTWEAQGESAFSIDSDGVYHVIFDLQRKEAIVTKIESWGVLGGGVFKNACESDGFDVDIDLAMQSASADGAVWTASDVILKDVGKIKIRYNDAWKIERRIETDPLPDPNNPYDPTNGYVGITNFGGTIDALEEGGSDMEFGETGLYTVTVEMSEFGVISLNVESTSSEAPTCAFDADDYMWGALGSAIDVDDTDASSVPDGWENADRNLYYKGVIDGEDTWIGVINIEGDGAFKFRTNDDWAFNIGVADGETLTTDGTFLTMTPGGSDIPSLGAGDYYVTVKTPDQGETWMVSATENGWGIIGAATPGGWDADTDLTGQGTVDGVTTYTVTVDMTVEEYKFRANDDWALNIGGDMSALTADGSNLSNGEAGNYTFTLSYDGETYTATSTKN